jgi:rhamnosyltransferase
VKVAVLLPVHRGGALLPRLLAAIAGQSRQPDAVWIAETEPSAEAAALAARYGARYVPVERGDYDHAGTRSRLARTCDADVLVLLSQDALPRDRHALGCLVRGFDERPALAGAFGRQVPPPGAHPFAVLKRQFLYPPESAIRRVAEGGPAGFTTTFFSNAFGAWRRRALESVGYFGERRLMAEDVATAAALLLAGHEIAYVADAVVEHANDVGTVAELRRYFDIGATHAQEPWIEAAFGPARRDGLRFVRFGMRHLARNRKLHLLPWFGLFTLAKRAAYGCGRRHHWLPRGWPAALSGFPEWWQRDAGAPRTARPGADPGARNQAPPAVRSRQSAPPA